MNQHTCKRLLLAAAVGLMIGAPPVAAQCCPVKPGDGDVVADATNTVTVAAVNYDAIEVQLADRIARLRWDLHDLSRTDVASDRAVRAKRSEYDRLRRELDAFRVARAQVTHEQRLAATLAAPQTVQTAAAEVESR